ncbi:MAG: hypothetical protein ACR2QZ_03110 [Woeseiaceae bacterium]
MKLHTLLALGLAVFVSACAEKEPQEMAETDEAETATDVTQVVEKDEMGTTAFLEHMHHHASQLGQLNAALEVGSLAAAQRPAYWLAGHEEVGGVPDGWQVYLDGMRDAANAVDSAGDITEARTAAERIEASCRGCHSAAGVEIEDLYVN